MMVSPSFSFARMQVVYRIAAGKLAVHEGGKRRVQRETTLLHELKDDNCREGLGHTGNAELMLEPSSCRSFAGLAIPAAPAHRHRDEPPSTSAT